MRAAELRVHASYKQNLTKRLHPFSTLSVIPGQTSARLNSNMKYFGMVGGKLGVMSKVDPLRPRSTSPELWRAAAVPAGTGWSKVVTATEYDADDADDIGASMRAAGGFRSTRPNNNSPGTSLLGSRSSTRNRRGELFTAEPPPATKPVEGPEPPAWLGSRSGLLCEPSEGGGPSATSLASGEACHSGSAPGSEWTSPGAGVVCDGDDQSSAFALSFTGSPREVSDDNGSEGAQAGNFWSIRGAGERQAAKAVRATPKPGVRTKSRRRHRKRGRLKARSGRGGGGGGGEITAPSTARPRSKCDVSSPEGIPRERELDMAQDPIDDSINSHSGVRRPQPELYDVWIPQHFFQGNGLPTLTRVRGLVEPQPRRPSRSKPTQAAVDKKSDGDTLAAKPPNQGVVALRQHREQNPEANKSCAIHYVGGPEDFLKGDTAPPQQTLVRAGSAGDGTASTYPVDSERQIASFAGVTDGPKEAPAEATHWSVRGDDGNDDDDERGARFRSDDTRCALVGDAAAVAPDGGGSIVGWEEQEGREKEQDDEEYFDYAKRFSWQTAAEVVTKAEAEAEAWSKEEQQRKQRISGHGCGDGSVSEVGGVF